MNKVQKSWAVDLFNLIRNEMPANFRDVIPEMTDANIKEIGQLFENEYSVEFNQFNQYLWTRVGRTYIWQRRFENPLDFKLGGDAQRDIVDVFTHMFRKGRLYDASGKNALNRTAQTPTEVITHRQNVKWTWHLTIDRVNFLNAFNSSGELEEYLAGQFTSMYNSPKMCDYLVSLAMLTPYAPNGELTADTSRLISQIDLSTSSKDATTEELKPTASIITNARNNMIVDIVGGVSAGEAKNFTHTQKLERVIMPFARTLKSVLEKIKYPHKEYNASGVENISRKENLTLYIPAEVSAYLDVDFYAMLFGANYAKVQDLKIKVIDSYIIPSTNAVDGAPIVVKANAITDCANPLDCAISQVGNDSEYFSRAYNLDDLFNGKDAGADSFIIPLATLCDDDYMRSFLNEYNVYPQNNADGDFINYFTHVRNTYSFAPFNNCVSFALGVADFFAEGDTASIKQNIAMVLGVSATAGVTSVSFDGEIQQKMPMYDSTSVVAGHIVKYIGLNVASGFSIPGTICDNTGTPLIQLPTLSADDGDAEFIIEYDNITGQFTVYKDSV